MKLPTMIRAAIPDDAAAICSIYNGYVENTTFSFEEKPVAHDEMAQRIADITASFPWLVLTENDVVLGYAYASPWKARCAYRFAAESSVYLAPDAVGKKLGLRLYEQLIAELRALGLHSVIGGISQPNSASVGLHEKMGFTKVAHFRQVGWKFGRWIDVGYWELML